MKAINVINTKKVTKYLAVLMFRKPSSLVFHLRGDFRTL